MTISSLSVSAFRDNYPKNPKIDVVNYSFKIALSDSTDEIICETTIDVRFKSAGIDRLRLDLINKAEKLDGKGMKVSGVSQGKIPLIFRHADDNLLIFLRSGSKAGQRTKFTVTYSGIPATGLKIANNKYGDRTFFSDNWPNKARNWLPLVDHPYDKATCEFIG